MTAPIVFKPSALKWLEDMDTIGLEGVSQLLQNEWHAGR